ncbi:CLUMA_CG015617, isoform A [Clunio marinus]|uniref:CLUMA_CG015617, isoform A n=1 Tax=Clunio marinus TaxID=568069 RepID=A0A1J1ISJ1_9DIPT|nr:CLUMA_CG015617, isoform A [Clunio marinus]
MPTKNQHQKTMIIMEKQTKMFYLLYLNRTNQHKKKLIARPFALKFIRSKQGMFVCNDCYALFFLSYLTSKHYLWIPHLVRNLSLMSSETNDVKRTINFKCFHDKKLTFSLWLVRVQIFNMLKQKRS